MSPDLERILHWSPVCTGRWRLHVASAIGAERTIICDGCRMHYPATPENRRAGMAENYAGVAGIVAANWGQAQLARQRGQA